MSSEFDDEGGLASGGNVSKGTVQSEILEKSILSEMRYKYCTESDFYGKDVINNGVPGWK
jgi:hypothetical protein